MDIYVNLLVDLFDELFGNEWNDASVTAEHHTWILQFFSCTACPCKFSSGHLRLSDGIGSKFHVCKLLSVFRSMLETSEFCEPMYFGVLLLVLSKLKRLVRNDGLDSVCQNSFLRYGQVNSALCILLKSSMNLMIHLPRFHCICNYFCFAGIVVETYQELWRKCLSSFCTSVCTPSLRSFLSATSPASVPE